MSIESIRRVTDLNAFRLLTEPRFDTIGKLYEIMRPEELKSARIPATAGVDRADFIEEEKVVPRNITALCDILVRGCKFGLQNPADARLIYTCIDHFLMAQSRILPNTLTGVSTDMLEDFSQLTDLANYMLGFVDVCDRMDLMNAPKEIEKTYDSIFDRMFGDLQTSNLTTTVAKQQYAGGLDEADNTGYQSPFSGLMHRRGINRTKRFS